MLNRGSAQVAKLVPLPADFDIERSISWEGKIWLAPDAERAGEVMLYASAEA